MRRLLYLSAILGAAGVLTGAFGAHTLKTTLIARDSLSIWNTAVLYHLIHASTLLAVALYGSFGSHTNATRWLTRAGTFWILGVLFFSGSLYGLALGGPRWLGPITPLGGVFFVAGWLCIIGAAAKSPKNTP